jgi:hypothetical protein
MIIQNTIDQVKLFNRSETFDFLIRQMADIIKIGDVLLSTILYRLRRIPRSG